MAWSRCSSSPNVNINSALAQITAASQTVLKLLPPGITPPYVLSFSASSVPILQLALSSNAMSQAEIFDAGQNFIRPQLATVAGTAVPSPYGGKVLQVQVDLNQDKLQAYGLSSQDVVNAIARQNVITPVGTEKVGKFEYVVDLNDAPTRIARTERLCPFAPSTACRSISTTSPTSTRAARRRPTWCGSTVRTPS